MSKLQDLHYFPDTESPNHTLRSGFNPETGKISTTRVLSRLGRLRGKTITAYKKCHWQTKKKPHGAGLHKIWWHDYTDHYVLVTLKIDGRTKRQQSKNYKCRAAKAKVVAIEELEWDNNLDNNLSNWKRTVSKKPRYKVARSWHDYSFKYKVGETVKPKDPYNEALTECSSGIHFFLTEDEALRYDLG